MSFIPYTEREQSEFNMAFASFSRVHEALCHANDSIRTKNASEWHNELLVMNLELTTYMKPDEIKNTVTELQQLGELINKSNNHPISRTIPVQRIRTDIFWRLYALDVFLRDIASKSGLLYKMKDNAANALR